MQRWHGLDMIRLVSFFAIAIFHITFIHYNTIDMAIVEHSGLLAVVEVVTRALAFSGFTIVFLACFLAAYSSMGRGSRLRLLAVLLIGWGVLVHLFWVTDSATLPWDIYPLLLVGLLMMAICERWPRLFGGMTALGALLLMIPFWALGNPLSLPPAAANIFGFAACSPAQSEWPVFPWIGLVWFGFGMGRVVRRTVDERPRQLRVGGVELACWAGVLAASLPSLGAYYHVRLGPLFACDAYRQTPLAWWSHFVWVLMVVRLSFDPRVQTWLNGIRSARWVSSLAISRSFWLAYVVHLMLAFLLSDIVESSGIEQTSWNAGVITTIAVLFLPMIEGTTRLLIFCRKIFGEWWQPSTAK